MLFQKLFLLTKARTSERSHKEHCVSSVRAYSEKTLVFLSTIFVRHLITYNRNKGLILSTSLFVIYHRSYLIASSTYLHPLILTLNPLHVTEMPFYILLKLGHCQTILDSNHEVKYVWQDLELWNNLIHFSFPLKQFLLSAWNVFSHVYLSIKQTLKLERKVADGFSTLGIQKYGSLVSNPAEITTQYTFITAKSVSV